MTGNMCNKFQCMGLAMLKLSQLELDICLGPWLLTEISYASTGVRAWMSKYIHIKQWDVITDPCPNFNGSLVKLPLKLAIDIDNRFSNCHSWATQSIKYRNIHYAQWHIMEVDELDQSIQSIQINGLLPIWCNWKHISLHENICD